MKRLLEHHVLHSQTKSLLKLAKNRSKLLIGIAMGLFFLNSCSEQAIVDNPVENEYQLQSLTLVPDPDQPIEIKDASNFLDSDPARATNAAGDDRGRFNISLKFVVPPTDRQREVFEEAADRWERIIIGDVPSFTGVIPSAFQGLPPAVDGTLDDIVIEIALIPIDGPFGVLGAAGPRFVRTIDFLTLSGVMFFDSDDLDFLEQLDLFEAVIVHEMGHVLGVGTLWNVAPFGFDRTLSEGPDTSPYFSGRKANVFWNAEGGTGELPIEFLGGPGTAFSHWQESTLQNELMTGFLNLGENPLSRITAGSMRDLGYVTSSVGESYELPKGTPGVDLSTLEEGDTSQGLHIGQMETILQPIGFVTYDEKK